MCITHRSVDTGHVIASVHTYAHAFISVCNIYMNCIHTHILIGWGSGNKGVLSLSLVSWRERWVHGGTFAEKTEPRKALVSNLNSKFSHGVKGSRKANANLHHLNLFSHFSASRLGLGECTCLPAPSPAGGCAFSAGYLHRGISCDLSSPLDSPSPFSSVLGNSTGKNPPN